MTIHHHADVQQQCNPSPGRLCSPAELENFMYILFFSFRFEGQVWDLIESVADHCFGSFSFRFEGRVWDLIESVP